MTTDNNIKLDFVILRDNVLTARFSYGNSASESFEVEREYADGYLGWAVDIDAWQELSRMTASWHNAAEQAIAALRRGR